MAKQAITISEALGWLKTLKSRQQELIQLRNANSAIEKSYYDDSHSKTERKPTYDAKLLDKRITLLAREIRLCDAALKKANATVNLPGYQQDDAVLGELE